MAVVPETKPKDRPVSEVAREFGIHPATLIRWGIKGKLLSDGTRERATMTRRPGGWWTTAEDVRQFLARLTADRISPAQPTIASSTERRREIAAADRALADAGF